MSNLLKCISYKKKYTKIIYPIISKRMNEYKVYTNRINKLAVKSNALEALDKNKFDIGVSSIYTLYPNVDITLATEVIFAYQALVQYLIAICEHSSACTEPFLKLIFSSLKDALNLRAEDYIKYFNFFPSKDDDGYLSILVEKCRQKVSLLPSFDIVRDYVATYITLFIDLQVTKYFSDARGKEINLLSWSSAHGQKYPDISSWEFCMSIDSPLSLQLLLAQATNPDLTETDVEKIHNSFFPWISGIQKILEGYLNYNDALFSQNINHIFCYNNLKEYEDRIIFFINNLFKNGTNYDYYNTIIKILLSMYITHPKANYGMHKLTSKALMEAGGRGMFLYNVTIKLLRANKYI